MDDQIIGNRYQIVDRIGSGGMGTVYAAFDRLTGDTVALKRVTLANEESRPTTDSLDGNGSFTLRLALAEEFKTLASLRHPYIISVLDYGFDDDQHPYLIMDLLENARPLNQAAAGQSLDVRVEYLVQTLQAVAYLHRRGVIHRDLKPDNVLVVDGQVKVLDFGLAVARDQISAQGDEVAGTLEYMAPELLTGSPPSKASDLYAIGVMTYEILAGQYPYRKNTVGILMSDIMSVTPDLSRLGLDSRYVDVLARLLAKKPEDRYQDAGEVVRAYTEAAGRQLKYEATAVRESFLQAAQFIGREQELQILTNALDEARDEGRGSAWLVGGESGVGKSRLMDEIRTRALVRGVLTLRGQGVVEGGAPYLLWREALRYLCLRAELSDLDIGVLKPVVPNIEQIMRREVPPPPVLEPQAAQERLFQVIEQLFRQREAPTLVMLEDAQWAGDESLALLKRLVQQLAGTPVIFIGSYRYDERPGLPSELPAMQAMRLQRLTMNEIAQLSASMLGDKIGRKEDLVSLLDRETEGNVFFIVEVVRALAEDAGNLEQIGVKSLPQQVFSGGMKTVVRTRLRNLPVSARPLLSLAAIAGRQVDLRLLETISPDVDIPGWLADCANGAVLEVQDNAWRFAHDKIREGILDLLNPDEQRDLHQQVASAIETLYAAAPEYAATLAYHWRGAQNAEKELSYSQEAGQSALKVSAFAEAIRFLERCIELRTGADPLDLAPIEFDLGVAYMGQSVYPDARRYYESALQKYRTLQDPERVALILSHLGYIVGYGMGQHELAKNYLDEALALVTDRKGTDGIKGNIYRGLASRAFVLGQFAEARNYSVEGLEIYKRLEDDFGIARFHNNIAVMDEFLGDYESSFYHFGESLRFAQKINSLPNVAHALRGKGNILNRLERYEEAETVLLEALEVLRLIGDLHLRALSYIGLSISNWQRGRYDEAHQHGMDGLQTSLQLGHPLVIANALNNLGELALRVHDYTNANDYFRQALDTARRTGAIALAAHTMTGLAALMIDQGETLLAVELLGLAQTHRSSDGVAKSRAAELLARVQPYLPPEDFAAALERGKTADLNQLIDRLLA